MSSFLEPRSVIKDALGKARSYLSNLANWNTSGKKKGQPGSPGASNHPTLYAEAFCLDLDATDLRPSPRTCFARLKVYTGTGWQWHNYPVKLSRYFEARWRDPDWEHQSPQLIVRQKSAALHFPQVKHVEAKRVKARKADPHLVTVEVNPHGTSQYCSQCGAKGERFSHRGGKRMVEKWGKLFFCPRCHYEANADHNASKNMHHSFYHELHWEWRDKRRADPAPSG